MASRRRWRAVRSAGSSASAFVPLGDLKRLADTFETKIYPTDREFFGSEWSPGIDDDVHLYVLYARGLGTSIAGYFSSADELPPQAHQYSNAHEMFMMSADNVQLGEPYIYGTVGFFRKEMLLSFQFDGESAFGRPLRWALSLA